MNSIPESKLHEDGFHITGFNATRPFSSFLPGIAGAYGKPMWVFYANRGQCIASFGVDNKNSAMLEFQPANKAYTLTPSHGFRTFLKLSCADEPVLYEPFQVTPANSVVQRLSVRIEEIELEETCAKRGLRIRVVYFTLPGEDLPALVRQVTLENIGSATIHARVLDGLPQIVPFGLEDRLLKQLSRTMEAFAEIRHVEENLPFFKLKVEPSDKPEVQWIDGGFFAFTLHDGIVVPTIVDPDQIFGSDTSLRTPLAFLQDDAIDASAARRDTMTGCAFANLSLALEPGQSASWSSLYGHATDWQQAEALRTRAMGDALYISRKRNENAELIRGIGAQFDLVAGPAQLAAYTRQAFVDNTLRGGQPVVIDGPRGPRVFHTFSRKHGDMERDYNFFEVSASYWSQGNGNFRDVNQNRRSENFIFPNLDASNIETFFNLIQLDGNNPLVIEAEKFLLPLDQRDGLFRDWPAGDTDTWRDFLAQPFSPGQLQERLTDAWGTPDMARPWFDRILGLSDKIQGAAHGEGYWVDHWTYNLDLLESYAAVYPDRMRSLLVQRRDFTYFDNDHVVQPRDRKYVLRTDGTVRQLHAVVQNADKTRLLSQRSQEAHTMRTGRGTGPIYHTTLLAKMLNLMAVKASLFDPFGMGLEMEAEKPGWCDALNGLPGLVGSSTHELYALQRWSRFTRQALHEPLAALDVLRLPVEVAELLRSVTQILELADQQNFFGSWQQLAGARESFRATTMMGIDGTETDINRDAIVAFLDAMDRMLDHAAHAAQDADGLPVSYYTNTITEFERLAPSESEDAPVHHVRAQRFVQKPVAPFLEGAVHALRSASGTPQAPAIYQAVRRSPLYDDKLGMYRVNAPLDAESFEIGRSRTFSPGWLENESIFLHMHYKFLLETLRSGQAAEFFQDMRQGLVAFQDPHVYGRSPLENSSFIASSRFPDPKVHGVGFVARLSGATAEWISMVLHMGLGAQPFRLVDGALRFEPRPVLADWLFTTQPVGDMGPGQFALMLFGTTWVVYDNPSGRSTFGDDAVAPVAFEAHFANATEQHHAGGWLPEGLALQLREGRLSRLVIRLS